MRPDALVVIKLLAGRVIDRADAAMVLRENRDEIDFPRLHREIARHGLAADYAEICRDAFPVEPVPSLEASARGDSHDSEALLARDRISWPA